MIHQASSPRSGRPSHSWLGTSLVSMRLVPPGAGVFFEKIETRMSRGGGGGASIYALGSINKLHPISEISLSLGARGRAEQRGGREMGEQARRLALFLSFLPSFLPSFLSFFAGGRAHICHNGASRARLMPLLFLFFLRRVFFPSLSDKGEQRKQEGDRLAASTDSRQTPPLGH